MKKYKRYKRILTKILKLRNKMKKTMLKEKDNTTNILSGSYRCLCESSQRLYDIIEIWRIIEQ